MYTYSYVTGRIVIVIHKLNEITDFRFASVLSGISLLATTTTTTTTSQQQKQKQKQQQQLQCKINNSSFNCHSIFVFMYNFALAILSTDFSLPQCHHQLSTFEAAFINGDKPFTYMIWPRYSTRLTYKHLAI